MCIAFAAINMTTPSRLKLKQGDATMRHNRLRALLTAETPPLAPPPRSPGPRVVELVGRGGHYDYVEFTAEYSPFDMHDLDNLGRAFEVAGLAGMIKIEQTQYVHQAMR